MKSLTTVIFCVILTSCNNDDRKSNPFKSFDFSFSDTFTDCFSIKFTSDDTVYIKQHFATAFSDSLRSGKYYYALIQSSDKHVLDSFLLNTHFKNLDSAYYESYSDGEEYAFSLENDSINKTFFVHSHSVPMDLKKFGYWIVSLKKRLIFSPIDTVISFRSATNFLLPNIEPPPLIFKSPRVE